MGSKAKKVKAPQVDLPQDVRKLLGAYQQTIGDVVGFEGQFRPQFQGLNLGDISAFLGGTGGQQGLFGLSSAATQAGVQDITAARQAELAGQTGQTGAVRGLLGALSPEGAAAVQRASQEAMRAQAAAQGLSPQEQRMAQQQSREAFASRGRIGDTAAVASEILGREGVLSQKRGEASAANQAALGMSQGFYGAPGLALLSQTPAGFEAGRGLLSAGLGAVGAGTPQLFDYGTAFNLGAADRQNQLAAAQANAQIQAQKRASTMGMVGQIAPAAIAAI